MPVYQHLFFDLDHTLWDFERNSAETLAELYETYDLPALGFTNVTQFQRTFSTINHGLWDRYNRGVITSEELRTSRFKLVFQACNLTNAPVPPGLSEAYIQQCSRKPYLLPYATEVLDYLQTKYPLHIITNGFADIQGVKMDSAGITAYFQNVVTSESAGCKKPQRAIFEYAVQAAGADPVTSLMIGDNLDCDIVGAQQAGLDTVYLNPERLPHAVQPTYEITSLQELLTLL